VLSRVARFLVFPLAVFGVVSAQPTRVVVDNIADLRACLNRPAGEPLVCALRSAPSPYAISGDSLIIRRSDTTLEGDTRPGEDPPTLKRTDASIKKLVWVQRMASNVTIRNLQIDGNGPLVPDKGFQDLSVDASYATVADNYFGNSSSLCVFFGGPHFTLRHNTLGKLIAGGAAHPAPGFRPGRTAVLGWGPTANQFTIESNDISDFNAAICINDAPGGTDPAQAGIIANNTLYHNSICVPDCGGGQIYLYRRTTNVKVTNNTINGGWAESSENRDVLHNYGIEMDGPSYIYSGSNQISNHSISGMWIGNGAHNVTVDHDTVTNNGLNGVQIMGPVSSVSIIGVTAQHNDQHRSSQAPYPKLPRFWGVMIQNDAGGVCIQSDSSLDANGKGAVYAERGRYSRSQACPRPYN
jgi:hypothetical protein